MSYAAKFESILCKNCEERFTPNYPGRIFCSKSCAATYNNSVTAKRTRTVRVCPDCGKDMKRLRGVRCQDCAREFSGQAVANMTLRELRKAYSTSEYHAKIRGHARAVYKKSGRPKECAHCKYSLHTDICHIRDVRDFTEDTKLITVNDPDNLVALCKNHHWEFDNGHLNL